MKKILLAMISLLVLAVYAQAQGIDFSTTYNKAQTLYNQKEYEKAIKMLETLDKSSIKISTSEKAKADELKKECKRAIAIRDRLDLVSQSITVGYENGTDSLGFDAGKPNQVTASSSASWCKVIGVSNGKIFFQTEFNPNKTERTATVTVKMAKIKTTKFTVVQKPRPETTKTVIFTTSPNNARVTVDDGETRTTECNVNLASGRYQIHFRKSGYAPKDTTITVADDMRSDSLRVHVNLTPSFGKIALNILPEDGYSFKQNPPVCTMNGIIAQANGIYYSYDDDRDIDRAYYSVHEDGCIPVPPSSNITIIANADHFQTYQETVVVPANTTKEVTIVLKANAGELTIFDMGNSSEAKVFMDGDYIGEAKDITRYPVLEGDHVITFEKEGYLSTEKNYPIYIRRDEQANLAVSMVRYVEYVFTSTPKDAQVYVNGTFIETTPTKPYILRENQPNEVYNIEIKKDNYLPIYRQLSPNYDALEVQTEHANMIPSSPLTITTDEPNLQITIKNKRRGDSTFVNLVDLPAEVMLPVRKNSYYVEMHRIGQKRAAYRNHFRFDDPSKNKKHFQSWSKNNFQLLAANYYLNGPHVSADILKANDYKFMGNVNLMNFRVFSGLSTSAVRGALFMGKNSDWSIMHNEAASKVVNAKVLPALSVLFINGDFRIGGAIFDYMDIDAIASYAWYPDLWRSFLTFSHVSGHDLFVGAEISSRTPVLNINLRMGMQMYPNMKAHLYCKPGNGIGSSEGYETINMNLPTALVVSVGFSLGSMKSKGNNILRIF